MIRFRSSRPLPGPRPDVPRPPRAACVEGLESRTFLSASPEALTVAPGPPVPPGSLPTFPPVLLPDYRPVFPSGPPAGTTVTLEKGVLTVTGSDAADTIHVAFTGLRNAHVRRPAPEVDFRNFPGGSYPVRLNGLLERIRARHRHELRYTRCEVSVNGSVPQSFRVSRVKSVVVRAGGGDDVVTLNGTAPAQVAGTPPFLYGGAQAVGVDAAVFGGDGNDSIIGGNGDDRLEGEAGNDTLRGWFGTDTISGGEGDDTLGKRNEGSGAHTLSGGPGTDSFVGIPAKVTDLEPGEVVTPTFDVVQ